MTLVTALAHDKRSSGRPRCLVARQSILDATVRLLESTPLQNLAIECIARAAGVGKATIYRWWPNKAAIVIDAFFEQVVPKTTFERTPTAAEAIERQAARMARILSGPQGRIVVLIIDLIYGPMWYRLMVGHQPLNREFAETFSRLAIAALKPVAS